MNLNLLFTVSMNVLGLSLTTYVGSVNNTTLTTSYKGYHTLCISLQCGFYMGAFPGLITVATAFILPWVDI